MKTNWFSTSLIAGSILFSAVATFAAMPKAGDTAPAFAGTDQDGKTVQLADFAGKKIVLLYFIRRISPAAAPRRRAVSATA